MNKVRKFYDKDKYFQDGECNYLNILGLALLLKRNKIINITAKKYEDFEHLITKEISKENVLAKKAKAFTNVFKQLIFCVLICEGIPYKPS